MRNFIIFALVVFCFFQSCFSQNISKRKEEKLQSKLEVANLLVKQGNKTDAINIYKEIREKGKHGQSSLIANDSIAWLSFDNIDLEEMYNSITFFSNYIKTKHDEIYQTEYELLNDSYFQLKNNLSISGDLCGIWVSDYTEDKHKAPYFALEIKKNNNNKYTAYIHPNCHVANNYLTPYQSIFGTLTANTSNVSELSQADCSIDWENDSVYIHFVEKKYTDGCPTCAKVVNTMGITLMESGQKAFKDITSDPYFFRAPSSVKTKVYATTVGTVAVGAAMVIAAIIIANSKTYACSIELRLSYITQGVMSCTISENILETSATGKNEHKTKTLKFNLFKLYPDYDIHFIGHNNKLIGSHQYTKKEEKELPEHKFNRKDILAYNTVNYEQLIKEFSLFHKKNSNDDPSILSDFARASSGKNYGVIPTSYGNYVGECQDGKPLNIPAEHIFKHDKQVSTKSVLIPTSAAKEYEKLEYDNAIFYGIVINGKREGKGINYGYNIHNETNELVCITQGEWKKGYLNGYAEQQYVKKHQLYKGLFKDNYKQGYGTLVDSILNIQYKGGWHTTTNHKEHLSGFVEERTLQDILIYEGNYKNSKRHGHGTEYLLNGNQYEGYWKKGKKHGKGIAKIFINSDSHETYIEKWKKGKLKKQKKYEE